MASVVTAICDNGGNATGVTGDATSFADIEAMRRQIEDRLGPVDILIANAVRPDSARGAGGHP